MNLQVKSGDDGMEKKIEAIVALGVARGYYSFIPCRAEASFWVWGKRWRGGIVGFAGFRAAFVYWFEVLELGV